MGPALIARLRFVAAYTREVRRRRRLDRAHKFLADELRRQVVTAYRLRDSDPDGWTPRHQALLDAGEVALLRHTTTTTESR